MSVLPAVGPGARPIRDCGCPSAQPLYPAGKFLTRVRGPGKAWGSERGWQAAGCSAGFRGPQCVITGWWWWEGPNRGVAHGSQPHRDPRCVLIHRPPFLRPLAQPEPPAPHPGHALHPRSPQAPREGRETREAVTCSQGRGGEPVLPTQQPPAPMAPAALGQAWPQPPSPWARDHMGKVGAAAPREPPGPRLPERCAGQLWTPLAESCVDGLWPGLCPHLTLALGLGVVGPQSLGVAPRWSGPWVTATGPRKNLRLQQLPRPPPRPHLCAGASWELPLRAPGPQTT